MLGALMITTKTAMEVIPNVHFLGLFIAAITLTYRVRALIPIYVFVMLQGVLLGFSVSWLFHLYIWIPLWGVFMIAGKFNLPLEVKIPLYMTLCGLHGLAYGTLCAPMQALVWGYNFNMTVAWIISGLSFDIPHAISNTAMGVLIIPLSELLKKLDKGRI